MNEQLTFYPEDVLTSKRFVQKLYDNNTLYNDKSVRDFIVMNYALGGIASVEQKACVYHYTRETVFRKD
ncbi:unnamed protein product [Schistosoma margrebowiei]|uniref:Uncharacterized protein n=1 Tax=Schistosoma margrebowiei TaxID=48269 RepID=A0A183LEA6_9TREM|nr:unnamed protein product [Schistosoma margrebowiei]